jgi:hypothetical protein
MAAEDKTNKDPLAPGYLRASTAEIEKAVVDLEIELLERRVREEKRNG